MVLRWPVHLVYSYECKQKYNPKTIRSLMCQIFCSEDEAAADTMEWKMPKGVDFSRLT